MLLQYPLYMTDGQVETYYAHVKARSPLLAAEEARSMVRDNLSDRFANRPESETQNELRDFEALLVIRGHHYGLSLYEA